jgi:DNA replicative helicase MCM subunit Mcm2 (Cdc46/Mcm family)
MVNMNEDEEDAMNAGRQGTLDPEEQEEVYAMSQQSQLYSKLAHSIAPAVFGRYIGLRRAHPGCLLSCATL